MLNTEKASASGVLDLDGHCRRVTAFSGFQEEYCITILGGQEKYSTFSTTYTLVYFDSPFLKSV